MDPTWMPSLWASWLLLIGGLVISAVVLIRVLVGGVTREPGRAPGEPGRPGRTSAQQILDERLARGEITLDQYQAMSRVLSGE